MGVGVVVAGDVVEEFADTRTAGNGFVEFIPIGSELHSHEAWFELVECFRVNQVACVDADSVAEIAAVLSG